MKPLPPEILLRVLDHVPRTAHDEDRIWHVATSRPALAPTLYPLARAHPYFRNVIREWFYATWRFEYLSTADGWFGGAAGEGCAGDDLETWLTRQVGRGNRTLVRKLGLEMHGAELLALFAPDEASELLQLPMDRGCWTRVLALLRKLRLNDLTIAILPQTCPSTCSEGSRFDEGDDFASEHFQVRTDYRWIVKAVLASLPSVPRAGIRFIVVGPQRAGVQEAERLVLPGEDVDCVANCSWAGLQTSTGFWHHCDLFAKEGCLIPEIVNWGGSGVDGLGSGSVEAVEDDAAGNLLGA
ncbi:hypothetical protein Tdes44962_MAKER04078 [Teratosphaeria destructans]|uniref:Uncharacterized protein n=1 Tax=Teratosphaeria destructans TaxID=418781 RepID=A0A9W7W0I0_9PEZI|nr:hypothetical protein Tdes44962_MAKER04078 [Teratosphaeria destructans]